MRINPLIYGSNKYNQKEIKMKNIAIKIMLKIYEKLVNAYKVARSVTMSVYNYIHSKGYSMYNFLKKILCKILLKTL